MTAMNVIMLLDKNVAAYHNDIKRSKPRTLARQAKEGGSRSKSLSRKEERSGQSQGQAAVRSRKLSTSNQQLPVLARSKEESVEVPVIVDEVTKWISGVNKSTTCRDIITVILKRSNDQFKDSDVKKFILCERWKKVERPLRHSSHLLDLWTAWGQDRQTVRFVLKRIRRTERKPVSRTDSKLWRRQQSGQNNDTKHPTVLQPEDKAEKKTDENLGEVNEIIRAILRQQTQLRSHIRRLESKKSSSSAPAQPSQPEPEKRPGGQEVVVEESREGKGYIMKTFLENVESEDFYSHDSGIGSGLATTITDWSISKESDTLDLTEEAEDAALTQFISELEKLVEINEKISSTEHHLQTLALRLEDARTKVTSRGKENIEQLQDEVEEVTKINSSKSHEIKKNDIAISHMEKNIQGRQTFLTTIELDINRAESCAKRLQKEFEREFETVGLCNDILTVCNEDLSDDDDDDDNTEKELNEENCDKNDSAADLINLSDDPSDYLQSNFSISATQNPFGALT